MGGFSLANPLLALGVLGLAAPIIIHFIFRRRSRVLEFSAMRFVLLSYKKIARRLLIQEYLLLAARCLMVALLAMALAGPLLARLVQGFKRGERPLAVMFVIDSSLSMTREHDGKTLHEHARERARDWLSQVAEGDRVGLIDAARLTSTGLVKDPEDVREALAQLTPAHAPTRMAQALSLADSQLANLGHMDRMILIFTDMQRTGWTGPMEANSDLPPIFLVDVAEGLEARNVSVGEVDVKRKSLAREESTEITATVNNYGEDEIKRVLIRAEFAGKVAAQGFVDVPPGESLDKTMTLTEAPEGAGVIRIEADDGMPGDNLVYFHLKGGAEVRALVVDGDPGANYLQSETYFLDHALDPRLYSQSRVRPRTVTVAEFEEARLDDYQIVIFANVEKIKPEAASRVKKFVEGGGGLLLALGDKVNADSYNAIFGELLPRELRGVKIAYVGAQGSGEIMDMRLESPAAGAELHPILSIFKDPSQGDLGLAGFKKYFLAQQEVVPRSKIVLRLTDGTPIMVEGRYGRGTVLLFTSSVDRAWNDLCIHPTYLPLFQQTAQYLADALMREDVGRLVAGSVIELPVAGDVTGARVLAPDGKVSECELIEEIGARRVRVGATELPGAYHVQYQRAGVDLSSSLDPADADRVMVLNVDPEESDLTRVTVDEIKSRAGAATVRLISSEQPLDPDGAEAVETRSYAGMLLCLLVAVAVLERTLSRK